MNGQGLLLLDGAAFSDALAWLRRSYPDARPRPLLHGTPYADVAHLGPILLEAPAGSQLYGAWARGTDGLHHAVWLEAQEDIDTLFASLQRRLRILAPDGRELWLRLADARPLLKAWQAGAQWPAGFWHGVNSVWLPGRDGPVLAWHNLTPELDGAPKAIDLKAQLTLDWVLLDALAQDPHSTEETHA